MAIKMKGIFKGFKYISQIFVYKEHEMEIGYPTDVKHVAHIGWDGSSVNAPSWMNDYTTSSDFSLSSLSNLVQTGDSKSMTMSSWSSQDFQQSGGLEPLSGIFADVPQNLPKVPKKPKRKKSNPSTSSRSSKSKASFSLDGTEPLEVRS